ncbi:MAG: adenylate/guanylate cyclase domain-containing protein, partial [Myxococcaceae bacterium]
MKPSDEALVEAVLLDEAQRGELLAARARAGLFTALCLGFPLIYLLSGRPLGAVNPLTVGLGLTLLFSWAWLVVVRRKLIAYRRWHSYATVVVDVLLYSAVSGAAMLRGPVSVAGFSIGAMPGLLTMALAVASAGIRQCRGASQLAGALAIAVHAAMLWWARGAADLHAMGPVVEEFSAPGTWIARGLVFGFTALMVGHASKHAHDIARRTGQSIGERERITSMFGRYVDKDIANAALAGHAGGETREVTVMFTDLRNFTAFSERLPPSKVLEVLNAHFAAILPVVHRHGGVVNKFIGDAIMATFGAPHRLEDHALRAVRAAL